MNEVVTQPTGKMASLAQQVEARMPMFTESLPKHIPVERFKRVIINAALRNPALADADRPTLMTSAMLAAQDGLLPDGREGAFVIFNTKMKVDQNGKQVDVWVPAVQWMPMVAGILKKIRNSKQVKAIVARVVYEGDDYDYWIDGEGEHLNYRPCDNPGKAIRVFAMAKTVDDELIVEPMTMAEVQKVRNVSRAKDSGPWKDWFEEMAKKTAIKRLAKRLPMSTDLDDLIRRDDELYDFKGDREASEAKRPQMSDFQERTFSEVPTGNVAIENETARQQAKESAQPSSPQQPSQPSADVPQTQTEEKSPAGAPTAETQASAGDTPDEPDEIFNDGFFAFGENKSIFDVPEKLSDADKAKWKNGYRAAELDRKAKGK
jgi:recombination protein RecT